jgi:hypothetical protein
MELVEVRGPQDGKFSVWQTDSFGNPIIWMATHTIRPPDSFFVPAGEHGDLIFAFTKTGVYEVDFRASAYLPRHDQSCNERRSHVLFRR